MPLINLDALARAPLAREPFIYTAAPDLVSPDNAAAIRADFPEIADSGLLPVEATRPGPKFREFLDEVDGPDFARALGEKFGVDLMGRPKMITVRGRCAKQDGRIHTDSKAKFVTVLFYFNDPWEAKAGRLRLLRSATDLNDMIAEIPPEAGTMIAFKRSDNSFHGHEPFEGVRRYVMINWMTSGLAASRELMRHRLSARVKQAAGWLRPETHAHA
jgi:SM-20-related protein